MMGRVGLMAALLLSAGCGAKQEAAEGAADTPRSASEQAPVVASQYGTAPTLDTMVINNVTTYCAFFEEGHEFVFDDPSTWQFLFVTMIGGSNSADAYDGLVSLNGERREVELISQQETDVGETRTYRTKTAPAAVIAIEMVRGEEGMESTNYTGTIGVTVPEGGEPVAFDGDCGV